ncbi:glutaredoxin 2 [Suttonella sp. R2A3]|uniref:glutaredoxin 2 n=1 Tax=Suttonella sp. R2A3 TaxID=2908648 RepID=UPI001F35F2E7|nr:glutaredoxin 2 [Suttonella sp. R2A3]UJF23916.1 glutaredoxin 2 [Suttonella sp. R2A3]
MKLYYYDHCPFCTRARMAAGLLNLNVEGIILDNDDEETPNALIGKKMLPILVKEDGEAIGESLDIVDYFYQVAGHTLDKTVRPEIKAWLEKVGDYAAHLVMPRVVEVGFEEFATQSAIDYYSVKKSQMVGDFADNIARSDEWLGRINADLETLAPLIGCAEAVNGQASSLEDILLFPILRNLSIVKGIDWAEKVHDYVVQMGRATDITPLFANAI